MKADTIRKAPNIDLEGKVDAWRALVAHMRPHGRIASMVLRSWMP